ncbi:unnamed protein product [Strongylus vulgaris]|uniref:G-protein coupled receptors family 1 profile domain-containing protein n=1 Tax=Strongylus vulgaris TaxID=40348 RepID=A0A3P7IR76_STRVU|nr:unnamed protein product [Strongylus vulgaris]
MMTGTPPIRFVMLHWFIPLLVTAPLWSCLQATYTVDIEIQLSTDVIAVVNMMSIITVVISFIICAFCYIPVILYMIRKKMPVNRTRRNEVRLSIQVAGLMVAFLLIFIYNIGNYTLIQLTQSPDYAGLIDLAGKWTYLYAITNAFLCCVQPWTCLILNKDIQIRLKGIIGCGRKKVVNTSIFVSSASVRCKDVTGRK